MTCVQTPHQATGAGTVCGIKLFFMTVESIPKFTRPAATLWATVPVHTKKLLLSNVWCAHCSHEVTMTDFAGIVVGGDLVLQGLCSECRGEVARVIEMG